MTVDLHIDTPWMFTKHGPFDLAEGAPHSKVSLPKMKEGGLDVAVFALYLPDYVQDGMGSSSIVARTVAEQLWGIKNQVPNALFGIEGARLLESGLKADFFYLVKNGLKYITLTHNRNNIYADSATDRPYHGGLSELGVKLVAEAEKNEIIVDVSHASDRTCEDVLKVATRPVIASHSGCRSIVNHVRNLPDYLIEGIAKTGGIIGVPFARNFVGPNMLAIVHHVQHLIKIAGVDYIAIGSDLDGAIMVRGVEDVSDWKAVSDEMESYGRVHVRDIRKIAGWNATRLLNIANS